MSGLPASSAVSSVWPKMGGSTTPGSNLTGQNPFSSGSTGLPSITNPNLPSTGFGNLPPPIPQPPNRPFPIGGGVNNPNLNNYGGANASIMPNSVAMNLMQNAQNEGYQRRLTQLEDENEQRRLATSNLTQMGTQLLQGQMDVQEQVLQYQFMLEQCMETLDHQNFVLNEQAEELALLRSKMRHFEYLMDALKNSKEGNNIMRNSVGDTSCMELNKLCCRDPLSLPAPSTSRFFAGGPTRVTSSTFQPFNPRYRSPNSRATAAANLDRNRSITPNPPANKNLPNTNERPARRFGQAN